ncbi:MAG: hypothetical protein JW763_02215 [candidate division Zixibacteria bacterium]|nr:hypothetical protein [candidate division Zixibacteria bacterium]
MLYWIYVLITVFLTVLIVMELFTEKNWKQQIALAMLLLPFVLRILQIK